LHGLAGDFVRCIEPHSESDPVALLIQALAAFGTCLGRTAHFEAEGDKHHLNLFTTLVGMSSKGRKGSSWGQVNKLFSRVEVNWKDRCKSGLTSGEGLIWHIRDAKWGEEDVVSNGQKVRQEVCVDDGVQDKRVLCVEPELASLLKVMARQGNIISAVLRQLWDGLKVQTLAKNNPVTATDAHVSLIAHITFEELLS
jgi:hypothetical protein